MAMTLLGISGSLRQRWQYQNGHRLRLRAAQLHQP